jgi:hypothetical protein
MHPTQLPSTEPGVDAGPAFLLRAAAVYLQRHGWCQEDYYQRDADNPTMPPACAAGAIAMACYGRVIDPPASHHGPEQADFTAAMNVLDDYLYERFGELPYTFNDTPGRTAAEVIGVLNAAADHHERTHGGAS